MESGKPWPKTPKCGEKISYFSPSTFFPFIIFLDFKASVILDFLFTFLKITCSPARCSGVSGAGEKTEKFKRGLGTIFYINKLIYNKKWKKVEIHCFKYKFRSIHNAVSISTISIPLLESSISYNEAKTLASEARENLHSKFSSLYKVTFGWFK